MTLQLPTPAEARPTTLEEFAAQDFSLLAEGQSEALYIQNTYRLVVGPDPLKNGHFCFAAHHTGTGGPVAAGIYPLDDINSQVRVAVARLNELATRENGPAPV